MSYMTENFKQTIKLLFFKNTTEIISFSMCVGNHSTMKDEVG